ncbi:MAG: hypothetical protein ACE5KO_05530 [Candidatus Bathyarchaeia archaeon]
MARFEMKGVFPASRDDLWKLLWMHWYRDDVTLSEIHPEIISRKIVSQGVDIVYKGLTYNASTVDEREIKLRGKISSSSWKIDSSPPDKVRLEVVESSGPVVKGSYFENLYSEVPGGTQVSTKVDIVLHGVPGLFQGWVIRRALNRADKQDLHYLNKMKL